MLRHPYDLRPDDLALNVSAGPSAAHQEVPRYHDAHSTSISHYQATDDYIGSATSASPYATGLRSKLAAMRDQTSSEQQLNVTNPKWFDPPQATPSNEAVHACRNALDSLRVARVDHSAATQHRNTTPALPAGLFVPPHGITGPSPSDVHIIDVVQTQIGYLTDKQLSVINSTLNAFEKSVTSAIGAVERRVASVEDSCAKLEHLVALEMKITRGECQALQERLQQAAQEKDTLIRRLAAGGGGGNISPDLQTGGGNGQSALLRRLVRSIDHQSTAHTAAEAATSPASQSQHQHAIGPTRTPPPPPPPPRSAHTFETPAVPHTSLSAL